MGYSITITNTNNKKFRFYDGEVKNLTYAMVTKLFKQALPDAGAEEAISINLGREKSVSFPFKLLATSDDAAVGTHTTTVKTVLEKTTYLESVFITSGVEDIYTIEITSTHFAPAAKPGIVTRLSFDPASENPNYVNGSMEFDIGGNQQ